MSKSNTEWANELAELIADSKEIISHMISVGDKQLALGVLEAHATRLMELEEDLKLRGTLTTAGLSQLKVIRKVCFGNGPMKEVKNKMGYSGAGYLSGDKWDTSTKKWASSSRVTYPSQASYAKCKHDPDLTFEVPLRDGVITVAASSSYDMEEAMPGLIFDLSGGMSKRTGDTQFVTGGTRFDSLNDLAKQPEIVRMEWAAGTAPPVGLEFWTNLLDLLEVDSTISFVCSDGHTRAGSALVVLIMVADPIATIDSALELVRKHFCKEVGTDKVQFAYLQAIDKQRQASQVASQN